MNGCTRLYLARHGEVNGDGRKRYNGHTDVDITGNGVLQMEALRDRLKDEPIAAVYSSDLMRSVKGAKIINGPHEAALAIRPEFRERGVGVWEGLTWEDIEGLYPDEWKAWLGDIVHFKPMGGESLLEVSGRVLPALKDILRENFGKEIVLIGHGGVNRVILADALGLGLDKIFRIEQRYGGLNIIDYYEDGIPVVKLLNG
ncbi:MAG: histidine phosphatase family protein [Nitrospirota bacterium]